jgi:hypothetical protein
MSKGFSPKRKAWPSLAAWLCLATAPTFAQTRVALVSTCGGEAGQNVLALADAVLSAETNIVLVERREVERVLDEQKLTRCGLSDSAQALAVGKLLGVEVFATLETFPSSCVMESNPTLFGISKLISFAFRAFAISSPSFLFSYLKANAAI